MAIELKIEGSKEHARWTGESLDVSKSLYRLHARMITGIERSTFPTCQVGCRGRPQHGKSCIGVECISDVPEPATPYPGERRLRRHLEGLEKTTEVHPSSVGSNVSCPSQLHSAKQKTKNKKQKTKNKKQKTKNKKQKNKKQKTKNKKQKKLAISLFLEGNHVFWEPSFTSSTQCVMLLGCYDNDARGVVNFELSPRGGLTAGRFWVKFPCRDRGLGRSYVICVAG